MRTERQLDLRTLLLFVAGMALVAVLLHLTVTGIFDYFKQRYAAADVNPNPMLTAAPDRKPPEPRLQPDAVTDLANFRAREDDVLLTYGWVDKPQGIVRIPISRALQLAATRGIPGLKGTQATVKEKP